MHTRSLFALLCYVPLFVAAQPGALDPTFGESDLGFGYGDGGPNGAETAAIRSDGRIMVGGGFGRYDGILCNTIVCLDADGHPYSGFQNTTFMGNRIEDMVLLPDDRAVVCGSFTGRVERFLPNGMQDPTFDPGAGAGGGGAFTISEQADGKLIMGGSFQTFDGVPRMRIVRMLPDGALDPSFDPGTGADGTVLACAIQSDGRILIAGEFTRYNGAEANHIARLLPDGQLDPSFQIGSGFDQVVKGLVLQSDGRILACGSFSTYNGASHESVIRLEADGTRDATFDAGNMNGSVEAVASGPDDTIYITGGVTVVEGITSRNVFRLFADGAVDTDFNTGLGSDAAPTGLLLMPNGKLMVLGWFERFGSYARTSTVLLNTDGTVDPTFGDATGINGRVNAVAIQPDQRVLVGGQFAGSYGDLSLVVARLMENGDPDPSFSMSVLVPDMVVYTIIPRADGRTVVGGYFGNGDLLKMLDANGVVDPDFDVAFQGGTSLFAATDQPDGKLLIAGSFTTINTVSRRGLARLNADWTLDTSFDPGTGINGFNSIRDLALQPDGRIVIVGNFTDYDGNAADGIARINADGSFDPSFLPGVVGSGSLQRVAVQADGTLLVCASASTTYNGVSVGYLFRLNSDGTLDDGWQDGTGPDGVVQDLAVEASGHVVIVGDFTAVNNTPRVRIARLQPDGQLDLAFQPGAGSNAILQAVTLAPSGNLLIAGELTAYDGVGRNRIARIVNDITSAVPTKPTSTSGHAYALDADRFFVPIPAASGTVRIDVLDATGRTVAAGLVPSAYENGIVVRTPFSLPTGQYHVCATRGTETNTYTVVIVR